MKNPFSKPTKSVIKFAKWAKKWWRRNNAEKKKRCNFPPAPLGNQYAKGCTTSGRPPIYDYVKEAQDLLDWSLRDDALRLYGFVDDKPYNWDNLREFAEKSTEFSQALVKAKARIAKRREEKVNAGLLKECIYNKTVHFIDLEYDDSDERKKNLDLARQLKKIEAEAKLKNEEKDKTPPMDELISMQNQNMILQSQIAKLQEQLASLSNKPKTE